MSSNDQELKAGHPPAVKAGGMRIKQSKHTQHAEAPAPMTAEEKEEYPEEKYGRRSLNLWVVMKYS
jgi:hypothetical protein